MFKNFNDASRHIITVAEHEARGSNHEYIGTEHILLALIAETLRPHRTGA